VTQTTFYSLTVSIPTTGGIITGTFTYAFNP